MKPLLLIFVLSLAACSKKAADTTTTDGTFIFYKTGLSQNAHWEIFINGKDYGPVPYVPVAPTCNDNTGFRLRMAPGTYSVQTKSLDGYAQGGPRSITLLSNECHIVSLY